MNNSDRPLRSIFADALEIDDAQQRAEFLSRACGTDTALRRDIEELLRAEAASGSFLPDQPGLGDAHAVLLPGAEASASAVSSLQIPITEKPGDLIGRYKLLQKIGEGGCGVVYMAEQEEPIRRKVALKVIKLGMDTKSVVARFEAERQALALMDHPNIARVLDGGATATGRPFFVMELVQGIKITKYCDQHTIGTRGRLELLVQVCQAVQHAHQKGIIHRDLKPSNILVTEVDGRPVPKVIDFGISKATGNVRLTDKTLFTAFEQFIGTPAYMSPEQAGMGKLDVDTRSDIYSLGVLLYETLTGRTPFDTQDLLSSGLDEICLTIRERQPVRPSTRLMALDRCEVTVAATQRGVDPGKLISLLRGDLDWIVMKCLEKDRTRRYETANGLALDIQRHLHDEPIVARPPSRMYEFRKTVQRHKAGFLAAAAVIVALVTGVLISTGEALSAMRAERARQSEARRATEEANRAREAERVAKTETSLAEQERARAEVNLYAADMNLAERAVEENNLDRAFDLLNRHRPSVGARDLRAWEWRHLWQLCQSDELFTLGPQLDAISGLAQSPDMKWLLATSGGADGPDGELKLWDLEQRRAAKTLSIGDSVASAVFSSDGELYAFGTSRHGISVCDAKLQREVSSLSINQNPRAGCGLAFAPNRHILAISDRAGRISLWDCQSKELPRILHGHTYSVPSVAFNKEGTLLASASWDHTVRLWDTASGSELRNFGKNEWWFQAVAFSPDGHLLAAGDWRGRVHVWGTIDYQRVALLTNHTTWLSAIGFSPDGKTLMSAGADYMIRFCNTSNWQQTGVLKGHRDEISAAIYSQDGRFVISGDKSGWIKVWSSVPKPSNSSEILMPVDWALDQVATAPDASSVVLIHTNKSFSWWSGSDLHEFGRFTNSNILDGSIDLAVAPGGKVMAVGTKRGDIRIFDLAAGEQRLTFQSGLDTGLRGLSFSIDGKLLLAAGSSALTLWDAPEYKLIASATRTDTNQVKGTAFSPDRSAIALATSTGILEMWKIPSPSTTSWKAHRGSFDLAFLPGGKTLVTAGADGSLTLWNPATQLPMQKLGRTSNAFYCVAVIPDGTRIAAGTANGVVELYDPVTGHQLAAMAAIAGHTDNISALAFTPDGTALLSVGRNGMRVWHAPILPELEANRLSENSR